jgi:transcription termination/antitermination protein NusA
MSQLVTSASTPLETVPDLGEGVIEKLNEAGVTSVEALADMTPEQLETIPGIGPKTVEKISIAVNNYFSSLEAGEGGGPDFQGSEDQPAGEPGGEELNTAPVEAGVNPVEGEPASDPQAGDATGVQAVPHAEAEDLLENEQTTEGTVMSNVEDAPNADENEVTTHEKHPGEEDIPREKQ